MWKPWNNETQYVWVWHLVINGHTLYVTSSIWGHLVLYVPDHSFLRKVSCVYLFFQIYHGYNLKFKTILLYKILFNLYKVTKEKKLKETAIFFIKFEENCPTFGRHCVKRRNLPNKQLVWKFPSEPRSPQRFDNEEIKPALCGPICFNNKKEKLK